MLDGYTTTFHEVHPEYLKSLELETVKKTLVKKATKNWLARNDKDRSKTCMRRMKKKFIGAFAKSYVNRELKKDMITFKAELDMFVNQIFGAFPALISSNQWLPTQEKVALINHLDDIHYRLGLPGWNRSEESLLADIRRPDDGWPWLKNDRLACQNLKENTIRRLMCYVRDEDMHVLSYNAFYDNIEHEIQLYLGALLEPSFAGDNELLALKFGRFGQLVGHEFMHAVMLFIDKRVRSLGNQYHTSNIVANACVYYAYRDGLARHNLTDNSVMATSEDVPDIEGLKLAYLAYKLQTAVTPPSVKPAQVANFSDDQLFFISFANARCDCAKVKLGEEPHSLDRLRAEIPPWQMPEFGKAFQCKPDSTYSKRKKCDVYSKLHPTPEIKA